MRERSLCLSWWSPARKKVPNMTTVIKSQHPLPLLSASVTITLRFARVAAWSRRSGAKSVWIHCFCWCLSFLAYLYDFSCKVFLIDCRIHSLSLLKNKKKKKKKKKQRKRKKISDFNKSAPILTTTIKLILVESFGIFLQNPFFSRGSCVCGREALWSNIWYVAYIIHCLCSVSDGRVNSNMACI